MRERRGSKEKKGRAGELSYVPSALHMHARGESEGVYGYYVAYNPITLLCISFMFIEMKVIHCHSCVMFAMKL